MEWAAVALALALILGLGIARALRAPGREPPGRAHAARTRKRLGDPAVSQEDAQDLARGFAEAERAAAHNLEALLEQRLHLVQSRRIPLRAIRAAPGPHTGRLVFADGTIVLVQARRPGELYRLALNIPDHALCVQGWTHKEDGTVLAFHWSDGQAELLVIGLDQAD